MRTSYLAVFLFLLAGGACAQPGAWQLYGEDYYHPTGFPPLTGFNVMAVGDLDGDGRDDYFALQDGGFMVATEDPDPAHYAWVSQWGTQILYPDVLLLSVRAMDLDNDAQDELVFLGDSLRIWEAETTNPWSWVRRDELLNQLYLPETAVDLVRGDFDGDGLLNQVRLAEDENGNVGPAIMDERLANGQWIAETYELDEAPAVRLFDGDMNHDGLSDFGLSVLVLNGWVMGIGYYAEEGTITPACWDDYNFCGPDGGDLDGDGQWEGLFATRWFPEYTLVETAVGTDGCLTMQPRHMLSPLTGPVAGTVMTPEGRRVLGFQNWYAGRWASPQRTCYGMTYSPRGWQPEAGIFGGLDEHVTRASLADMDGDTRADLLTVCERTDSVRRVFLTKNTSSSTADSFLYGQRIRLLEFEPTPGIRIKQQQIMTLADSPRGLMVILRELVGLPSQLEFYLLDGEIVYHDFMSATDFYTDAPAGLTYFRCGDLDGDGSQELVGRDSTGWQVWRFVEMAWQPWAVELPDLGQEEEISFADVDDDGDEDLFTADQLYLNLIPQAVEEPVVPRPGELELAAYPNPFNAATRLSFTLERPGPVTLRIFDVLGRQVAEVAPGSLTAGRHELSWNADEAGSGIYFARLEAAGQTDTRKLMLVK